MSQIKRTWYAMMVTLGLSVATIIYFRVVVDNLQPLVTGEFSGVFTDEAELAIAIVPIAFGIIIVATWAWVLISPQQEEQKVARVRPPR